MKLWTNDIFLMFCSNTELTNLCKINSSFSSFNYQDIFSYSYDVMTISETHLGCSLLMYDVSTKLN
jgi:hypothetical protein